LKTTTTQPSFEFDNNDEVEAEVEQEEFSEPEKIVFNLEDEIEEEIDEIVAEEELEVENEEVADFTFELNESIEIEEEEEEFSMKMDCLDDNDNESPFLMSSDEEKEEKKETIIWNLNDVINEEASNIDEEVNQHVAAESAEEITSSLEPVYTKRIPEEEQKRLSAERIRRIKELGGRMKTPSGISELEKEPAYKRRQISLDSIPHSSENTMSRFTLGEDEDGSPKLKDDNSFLHDNVD